MNHTTGSCYHVDNGTGSDENDGRSEDRAWRSIEKVNTVRLQDGDSVLFRGGQVFSGTLAIIGSNGVLVSSFGEGRATIYGGSAHGIVLERVGGVTVREITVAGCGRKAGSDGSGMRIIDCADVTIDGVEARGFRLCGIEARGGSGLRLYGIHSHHNGAAGIQVNRGADIARDIIIRDCIVHDNAGDPKKLDNHSGNGIVVGGLDGCLIEYCRSYNNGYDMPRTGNGPVGIWGYAAHRLTIQYCISHDNKTSPGGMDGGGFDFDGGVTDSVLQYNLSYNNHGSGYLLCQYPGAAMWKNNRCAFNISINDGRTNHHAGIHLWAGDDGISDAEVSHNLIVNDRHAITGSSTENLQGFVFKNNILVSEETVISGPLRTLQFERNHVWSRRDKGIFTDGTGELLEFDAWKNADRDASPSTGDPEVSLPPSLAELPTSPRELTRMPWGRLATGSPIRGTGLSATADEHDLFGNPVGSRRSPGVDQAP